MWPWAQVKVGVRHVDLGRLASGARLQPTGLWGRGSLQPARPCASYSVELPTPQASKMGGSNDTCLTLL